MSVAATTLQPPLAGSGEDGLSNIVPAPLRADLVMQRQLFRQNEYYVIKDPLALTYFRLQHEEGFLVTLLDGRRTLGEVHRRFHERFPNKELSLQELAMFVNQMSSAGLLNINAGRFVTVAKAQETVRKSWILMWGKLLSGLLFMKFPLVDPSGWLGRLSHAIRFVWRPWFVGICLAFISWTIFWLIVNREAFAQNTINFFSPGNLFLVWLTIIVVKTLHEFGHATTCRHFGGEVHEMGVCLICFAPAGYVDASDAWMMRNKTHKLYTTIAGIFTEFVIASIAAHLWLYLPPGLAKNLAFNAMIVASVNTVFFNANPLMKFDGYYVVADLLEIPNLRAKAMTYCSYHLQRLLFGFRNLTQETVLGDERHNRVFIVYSLLAYAYMVMIIYSMTQVFAQFLAPYGLRDFGLMLGIFVQASFLMFPVFRILSDAFSMGRENAVREQNVWVRVARWLIPTVIGITALAFIPSRHRVTEQGVIVAAASERAGIEVNGIVEQIHVHTGQWVEAGQPLVTLRNDEVLADAKIAQLDYDAAYIAFTSLQVAASLVEGARAPKAALELEAAATARDRARRDVAQLVVRAPSSGYVTTPDIDRLAGRYLPAGFNALRIADLREFKILIPLVEADAELIEIGSAVEARAHARAIGLEGKITVLPRQKARWEDYHPAMLSAFGGPAPIEFNADQDAPAPTFSLFLAEADLDNAPSGLIEGLRVKVKIKGKEATYGRRIWRWMVGLWRSRSLA